MITKAKVYWSEENKRSICQQALSDTEPVAQVARRNGLNKGRLYNWLKDARYNPSLSAAVPKTEPPAFIPVSVEQTASNEDIAPEVSQDFTSISSQLVIEIRLVAGHEVRLSGCMSGEQITSILQGLAP
ncbi:IS66-like element accessory protein TnpA [Flexibacterium corallicola]|uniref:IS66-like element accessory protein TnpA n=1 Tax=Flexibacterium corallicola TaxID=3037259 RepID=UPI00286F5474|nr:transposase [Pseudovibrio sp. M1P-2-3]